MVPCVCVCVLIRQLPDVSVMLLFVSVRICAQNHNLYAQLHPYYPEALGAVQPVWAGWYKSGLLLIQGRCNSHKTLLCTHTLSLSLALARSLPSQMVQRNCYSHVIILFVCLHSAVNPPGTSFCSLLTLLQSSFSCQSQNIAEGKKQTKKTVKRQSQGERSRRGEKTGERGGECNITLVKENDQRNSKMWGLYNKKKRIKEKKENIRSFKVEVLDTGQEVNFAEQLKSEIIMFIFSSCGK